MRRKDREITDKAEIAAILRESPVLHLAVSDGDQPYIVPLCFGFEEGALYVHSAPEGKKIDLIQKNPRICFEVDHCNGIIKGSRACSWGMRYRSVVGFGRADLLTGPAEKKHGLSCIMQHYGGGTPEFSDEEIKNVTVIRITIESMTAKKKE
jgi:nitroimidazol reductase NimA-like FMN-containing flavoprotein (pyridoxamine 5'-phosphate oxidase superfamily)